MAIANRTAWQIALYVNVHDAKALHRAAMAQATGDNGMSAREAREFLGTARHPDIGACLRHLLDPGIAPNGCEIVDSSAEGGDSLT